MKARLALLAALLALPAVADIYKCRLPDGKTEISNIPCPSAGGTITVRPDEKVSEAARRDAEREVERMRSYIEQREAAQRAEQAEREKQATREVSTPALPRSYGSLDECKRDLDRQPLDPAARQQLEAECPKYLVPQGSPSQTVYGPLRGNYGNDHSTCIQEVRRLKLPAAERSQRLRDCEAGYIATPQPRPWPGPQTVAPTVPKPESKPAAPAAGSRSICPPANKNCGR